MGRHLQAVPLLAGCSRDGNVGHAQGQRSVCLDKSAVVRVCCSIAGVGSHCFSELCFLNCMVARLYMLQQALNTQVSMSVTSLFCTKTNAGVAVTSLGSLAE